MARDIARLTVLIGVLLTACGERGVDEVWVAEDTASDTAEPLDVASPHDNAELWDAVPGPTTAQVVAYAWIPDASASLGEVSGDFVYTASGENVSLIRSSIGSYELSFGGVDLTHANVQVSAYASHHVCTASGWRGEVVSVRCFDGGRPSDSQFTVLAVALSETSRARLTGFALADAPTQVSYTANGAYNAAAGAVVVTRHDIGSYQVAFGGATLTDGNVQVSAHQGAHHCSVDQWFDDSAYVRCFTPTGAPVDGVFSVLLAQPAVASAVESRASAVVEFSPAGNIALVEDASFLVPGSLSPVEVERTSEGLFALSVDGENLLAGAVEVCARSSAPRTCSVGERSPERVVIACFDGDGAHADSGFSLLYAR